MTAFAVAIGCLLSAGAGFCIGMLWADRIDRRAEQEERRRLWLAERMTRVSVDIARGTALTVEQVEQALLKAMQAGPR